MVDLLRERHFNEHHFNELHFNVGSSDEEEIGNAAPSSVSAAIEDQEGKLLYCFYWPRSS